MSFQVPIALQLIEEEIRGLPMPTTPETLYQPIGYLMALGGKRIRPLLVLLGYYMFDDRWQQAVKASLTVEIFHNFTLMHDDIMDKAPSRRGQPTVHIKWNENTALLAGDVMLVKAYEQLAFVPEQHFREVWAAFNTCAAQVCEGQQFDMEFEQLSTVTEEAYLDMIRLKTSVLLGFSLQMGAIMAGANRQQQKLIYDFGVNIGIGFQLKDDMLDVFGEQSKVGKQVGGDILANKKTFLLLNALRLANATQKQTLQHWLSRHDSPQEKVHAVTQIYEEIGIRQLTENKIKGYFDTAFGQLEHLEVTALKKQLLQGFTTDLFNREK